MRRRPRLRRVAVEGGSVALAAVMLVWSLLPIYNMALIALDPADGNVEFNGDLLPPAPSLNSFVRVVTGADGVFEEFWQAFGNSSLYGRRDDGADRADRVADGFRDRPPETCAGSGCCRTRRC